MARNHVWHTFPPLGKRAPWTHSRGEMMTRKTLAAVVGLGLAVAACTSDPYTGETKLSNTAAGAGIGAAVGAAAGALIGVGTSAKTRTAALVGAGIGALAGAGVGAYMDQQESELRNQLRASGVSVSRVGDDIVLNMPGNVTFDFAKADIRPNFYQVLNSVAIVLNKYNRTLIDINGHTDSIGSDEANRKLSLKRAEAVAQYLAGQRVIPQRMAINGFGEAQPIAPNNTDQGRALNRRVEIRIVPLRQG